MRYFHLSIFLLFLSFSCGGGGGDSGVNNAVYYIDPSVSDNGTGTLDSPFKTLSGINFEPGAEYLIKRGTVLEEQITVNSSGRSGDPIAIGAYGTGADPVIDGSEIVETAGWSGPVSDVYSNILPPTAAFGRGNVTIDNVIQNFTTGTPGSGEYTIDSSGKIQINGSPSGKTVRLSRRYFGIHGNNVSYIKIKNIHIRQASLHGIHFENSDNITVDNCRIEMCGGAFIGTLQAGNGIEFGNSSSDCTVTDCTVTDIFDSGITPQTYDNNQSASGFTFTGNTISKCGFAGIEIAVLRNIDKSGSSISNVTVKNNTISNCGEGFSGIRHGNEGRGIKIAADSGAGTISGVSVDRCFLDSNQTGIFISGNTDVVLINRSGFTSNGYGIAAYDIQGATTLKTKISSSIFYLNTIGFGYNVDNGNGNTFELYHNTFYDNSTVALSVTSFEGTPVLKNNIFYASTERLQIFSTTFTGYIINNNCFRECNSFIAHGTISSPEYYNTLTDWGYNNGSNITSDPLFVNASGCNFDLLSGSPCITKGASGTGVATDYSGKTFHSTTPSIGAYEY